MDHHQVDHHQGLVVQLIEMIMVIEFKVLAKQISKFCA